MLQTVHWQVFSDADALRERAADLVLEAAQAAIAARRAFHIALAGGRTPLAVYARLAEAKAEWGGWQVYFGDERCLPVGDPGRNDTMARRAWLDRVPLPRANLHPIPAELGPKAAAARYTEILRAVSDFDLVLLGLGEDGHTASLFPGQQLGAGPEDPVVLEVHAAPKPPRERVSLSAWRLGRARRVLVLVSGAAKRAAVHAWRAGANIPAAHIVPTGGVDVLLDEAAAGG
jgi:6-phosphogluconolactonase